MSVELMERPVAQNNDNDVPKLKHIRQTSERTYCGRKVKNLLPTPPANEQCVVCLDLAMYGRFAVR